MRTEKATDYDQEGTDMGQLPPEPGHSILYHFYLFRFILTIPHINKRTLTIPPEIRIRV